jgi:hypothetical protein
MMLVSTGLSKSSVLSYVLLRQSTVSSHVSSRHSCLGIMAAIRDLHATLLRAVAMEHAAVRTLSEILVVDGDLVTMAILCSYCKMAGHTKDYCWAYQKSMNGGSRGRDGDVHIYSNVATVSDLTDGASCLFSMSFDAFGRDISDV